MLAAQKRSRAQAPIRRSPPELHNGDCLKSGEFLRRYEGMPELKKAELIEGKVFMGSPVSASEHGEQDGIMCFTKDRHGRKRVNPKGYIMGPIELVAEISASSESIDLGDKLRVYARCGVHEYLVWRTRDEAFDWFVLEKEVYRGQKPDARGILRSRFFPGLELDVQALLRLDAAQVLARLQRALGTPAHAAFVAQHR